MIYARLCLFKIGFSFLKIIILYIFNAIIEEPAVNVAYINPQLTRWPEESSVSFKIETSSEYDSHRENMSSAKRKQCKFAYIINIVFFLI